jgi:hypothetical protein
MHSAALGLSYYVWRRTRWLVVSAALYLLVLAIAVRLIPTIASPFIRIPLLAPLAAVIIGLLGTLTLEQVNFEVAASVYPTNLLIRPATTRSLVLWPMLYAVVIAVATVFLIDRFLLTRLALPNFPIGPRAVNIVLPFIAAAFIAWLQVISWIPIPIPRPAIGDGARQHRPRTSGLQRGRHRPPPRAPWRWTIAVPDLFTVYDPVT